MESLNEANESRKFYHAVNMMKKGYQPKLTACKDRHGQLIEDEGQVLERWAEHFSTILAGDGTEETLEAPNPNIPDPLLEEPSIEEVNGVLKTMKNNKAPGDDLITAELLKHGGPELEKKLHELMCLIWRTESMPEEWRLGLIVPVFKKGDKLQCSNYRGITLLNVAYKLLSGIVLRRLSVFSEDLLGEYQAGFRPNRSTMDQIFTVRQILEKFHEYGIDLHMLFIDYVQAFDQLSRNGLIRALLRLGIPRKLVSLVSMTLRDCEARVLVSGRVSQPFSVGRGVRQGDGLSAVLFNLALHSAINAVDPGGTIFHKSSQLCGYADDIAILSRSLSALEGLFAQLELETRELGLAVSSSKTKYMKLSAREQRNVEDVSLNGTTFESVTEFKYLGTLLNKENKVSDEIQKRIVAGGRAYYAAIKIFRSRLLSRTTKLKLYKTLIRPIVTYGSEAWTMSDKDENSLLVFERRILRRIFGAKCVAGVWKIRTNGELDLLIEGENIVRFIKAQRLRWIGHVQRMPDCRAPKKVLDQRMVGTRRRGRPRRRWLTDVTDDLRTMRVTDWRETAGDRVRWRTIVREARAHTGL